MDIATTLKSGNFPSFTVEENDVFGGIQIMVWFENNQGLSIVSHSGSYGVEAAVVKRENPTDKRWEIDYSTPITGDVLSWLTQQELQDTLMAVAKLPKIGTKINH